MTESPGTSSLARLDRFAVQGLLDSVPSFRAAMEQTTRERLGTPDA